MRLYIYFSDIFIRFVLWLYALVYTETTLYFLLLLLLLVFFLICVYFTLLRDSSSILRSKLICV